MNPPVMEMKMILAMLTQAISGIETAQERLEIQRRDLSRQVDWLKEEIRKALETAPPPTTDLDVIWERMKPHWHGDMGPAFMFVREVEHLFKPEISSRGFSGSDTKNPTPARFPGRRAGK